MRVHRTGHRARPARALLAMVLVGTVLWVTPAGAESPAPKVVLRIGTTTDLFTDNPFAVTANSDWEVVTSSYDMLMKFGDDDLRPAPSLAESCDHSADYITWTCHLRDGLKWSDGTPLTAEDVAFSYRFVIDHHISVYDSYFPSHPTFSTPDARTLVWTSDAPTFAPAMPPWVYVIPEHVWGKYADADLKTIKGAPNTPSVTSGPFHLVEWDHGRSWTLDRNPEYWGPKPAVDEIQFHLYTNEEALVQALRNGEVDMIDSFEPSLLATLEKTPNVTVQKSLPDWWLNLAFNFGGQGPQSNPLPALHDLRLRTAIEMAIDKKEIVQKVYQGSATPGDTVVRPASAYWHLNIPSGEEIPYSPDAANQLLDQAGYKDTDGDGIREDPKTGDPLVLRMPASEDTEGAVEAGQLIVGFLKVIGIDVRLQAASDAKMGDYWGNGNFDAYIWYWSGDPDPNYQLSVFTSSQCANLSDGCFKDPQYDQLYDEQRSTMDQQARLTIVQNAQRLLYQQIPGIVLAYPNNLAAYRTDRFTGWIPAPKGGYLIPGYNYDSLTNITPVSASVATADSGSTGLPPWIWLLVLVGLGLIGMRMLRGRRHVGDEEA
jgi:peptide/nickel transport system substrate-binding protein